MTITPRSLASAEGERFEHGSVLGGKTGAAWVSSQWKSTFGFQVEDVARALAISAEAYRKLEGGLHRFKAVQLLAVARIFGISPTVFFEEIAMKNGNILHFEKPIAK